MMQYIFIDTWYFIALLNPHDHSHEKAKIMGQSLEKNETKLITSRAVLIELLDGFATRGVHFRKQALNLVENLENRANVEIIEFSKGLLKKAMEKFCQFDDKTCGLTDCISFSIMSERKINQALTYDDHFTQAGYIALARSTETSEERRM